MSFNPTMYEDMEFYAFMMAATFVRLEVSKAPLDWYYEMRKIAEEKADGKSISDR